MNGWTDGRPPPPEQVYDAERIAAAVRQVQLTPRAPEPTPAMALQITWPTRVGFSVHQPIPEAADADWVAGMATMMAHAMHPDLLATSCWQVVPHRPPGRRQPTPAVT